MNSNQIQTTPVVPSAIPTNDGQVKRNQRPENKPTEVKPENNIGKELSSPGAEPPKDPNNADAAKAEELARKKAQVVENFKFSNSPMARGRDNFMGGKDKPITNEQLRILIEAGITNLNGKYFAQGIKLNNMNLKGLNFIGSVLPEADFSNSTIDGCKFDQAFLRGSSFKGSILQDLGLQQTNFMHCSFENAKLNDLTFLKANLVHSNLTNAEINNSHFISCSMQLSNWQKAKITGLPSSAKAICFAYSDFSGEDFTKANPEFLAKSILFETSCAHAKFDGMELPIKSFFRQGDPGENTFNDFSNASLKGTKFIAEPDQKLAINKAVFSAANLEGADLSEISKLDSVKFIGTKLNDIKFTEGLELENCDIRLAKGLDNIDLEKLSLCESIRFLENDFEFEQLKKLTKLGIKEKISLENLSFFDNGELRGLDLQDANLKDTIIIGPLDFCNLRNVYFGQGNSRTRFFAPEDSNIIDLKCSDFRGSNVDEVSIQANAQVDAAGVLVDENSKFLEGKNRDLSITRANSNTIINHKDLSNRDLSSAEFKKILLIDVDLSNSNLTHATLTKVKVVNPTINNTNFELAFFDTSDLAGAKFINSNFNQANFHLSNLKEARFDGSTLKNTDFGNSNLERANLLNAHSLEGANLNYHDVAFAVGGHRNIEINKTRTRKLFIERGCDLGRKDGLKAKEAKSE